MPNNSVNLPPPSAFTATGNGRIREIVTDLNLSLPFLPQVPPTSNPALFPAKALWDTGATNCAITKEKAMEIGLAVVGKANVGHADGESIQNVYLLNLYLPNRIVIPMVRATECKSAKGNFDFIIGMDIITLGDFALTNVGGISTVSFRIPPSRTIDYVKEINGKIIVNQKFEKLGRNE